MARTSISVGSNRTTPQRRLFDIGYLGYADIANGQWADAAGGVTTNGFDPVQGHINSRKGVS